jgi:hypothetical protein
MTFAPIPGALAPAEAAINLCAIAADASGEAQINTIRKHSLFFCLGVLAFARKVL